VLVSLTAGLIWQFVLVLIAVRREQGYEHRVGAIGSSRSSRSLRASPTLQPSTQEVRRCGDVQHVRKGRHRASRKTNDVRRIRPVTIARSKVHRRRIPVRYLWVEGTPAQKVPIRIAIQLSAHDGLLSQVLSGLGRPSNESSGNAARLVMGCPPGLLHAGSARPTGRRNPRPPAATARARKGRVGTGCCGSLWLASK
jgi:hypothetical protein